MASTDSLSQCSESVTTNASSPIDTLPDEILMKILDFAMMTEEPLDLENTINLSRRSRFINDSIQRMIYPPQEVFMSDSVTAIDMAAPTMSMDLKVFPSWHRVHRQDWLIVNGTCSRFRRLGREYYWINRKCIVTTDLLAKLDDAEGSTSPLARPFAHSLLLDHIQDLIVIGLSVQSASKFIRLPHLLKFCPNVKSCTLVLDHSISQKLDAIKEQKILTDTDAEGQNLAESSTKQMQTLMVGLGVSERVKFMFAISQPSEWPRKEVTLKKNVFPMLELRRKWMMPKTKPSEPADQQATGGGSN